MLTTPLKHAWRFALWPTRTEAVAAVFAVLFFGFIDVALYQVASQTSGWAGPHAALVMHLVVDLSLLLVYRFPVAVSSFLLAVCLAMAISELTTPGLLVPLDRATVALVPAATPAVVVNLTRLVDRRTALPFVAAFTVLAGQLWDPTWTVTPFGLLSATMPALAVMYIDARKQLVTSLRDRAERAEREQELLAERARAQERRLLASEMHDVVTHRLSLMVLHAGALGVTSKDPAVRSAAEEIRGAGTQALDELRDLVGVLRSDQAEQQAPGSRRADATSPRPDPAALVREARAVGEDVDFVVEGEPGDVSPAVSRTAYRVVQEALTNIRKHAPGSAVRVSLRHRPDGMQIEVGNGPGRHAPDGVLAGSGSGSGLLGLRQRVELVGGTFDSGRSPDGGYRLNAMLPAYVPTHESDLHDSGGRRR